VTVGPASAPVDTIVAPATASGPGERAIVRLSGPETFALVGRLLELERLPPPGHVAPAELDLGGGAHVPLEVLAFPAPRSATGEDVAELHLPAWPPVVAELLRRCVEGGARPAARGEFTRRAVASGRLDGARALAVGRLYDARSPEEVTAAATALTGPAARLGRQLRDALLDVLADLEAHVDFEDEDAEAVDVSALHRAVDRAAGLAAALVSDVERAPPADGETDVVLLGPPNAGKSTLVMALCPGTELAVSPVAGTTRDALCARVQRGGRSWRFLDGPGVDPGAPTLGDLDRAAMDLFLEQLPDAAVVLHVRDVTVAWPDAGADLRARAAGDRPALTVVTKIDRVDDAPRGPGSRRVGDTTGEGLGDPAHGARACEAPEGRALAGGAPPLGALGSAEAVHVSARTGEGLASLWTALEQLAPAARLPSAATRGEAQAARDVAAALQAALSGATAAELPLLSLTLREAVARLEAEAEQPLDISEEVLDRLFARFCIGK
jgi:tRNA modification GTPase